VGLSLPESMAGQGSGRQESQRVSVGLLPASPAVTADELYGRLDGNRFAVVRRARRVLQLLESDFQGFAHYLALVAARLGPREVLHPGFVAGLQLAGVDFHRQQQHPFAAELSVDLRVLLKEFEDDGLVSHVGLLLRGCRVQTRNWIAATNQYRERD